MELSLQTIFFLLVAFAVGAAVMLYMIGHWLDLSGFRYKMETQRNALNLLQTIVSNSPLVQKDPSNEPNKLVLNDAKLNTYMGIDMYGSDNNPWRNAWRECCEFRDLDYKLTVIDLEDDPDSVWNIGELPLKTDDESDCYPKRVKAYVDMPVVIFRNGKDYHPGFISLTMTKTVLSDLSFWLSQAFVRASWTSQDVFNEPFEVLVPTDPEIEDVSIYRTTGLVCVKIRRPGEPIHGRVMCKPFTTTSAELWDEAGGPRTEVTINNQYPDLCLNVWIVTDRENGKVTVK